MREVCRAATSSKWAGVCGRTAVEKVQRWLTDHLRLVVAGVSGYSAASSSRSRVACLATSPSLQWSGSKPELPYGPNRLFLTLSLTTSTRMLRIPS